MPTERRIRKDFPNPELAMARVFRARKDYPCSWWHAFVSECNDIKRGDVYVRVSETRIPICATHAHFTPDDIITITKGE